MGVQGTVLHRDVSAICPEKGGDGWGWHQVRKENESGHELPRAQSGIKGRGEGSGRREGEEERSHLPRR